MDIVSSEKLDVLVKDRLWYRNLQTRTVTPHIKGKKDRGRRRSPPIGALVLSLAFSLAHGQSPMCGGVLRLNTFCGVHFGEFLSRVRPYFKVLPNMKSIEIK